MTDIDAKERKLMAQFFARFKFDMIDAMMVDDRLSPKDFKVGVALLQMQNSDTGALYPSQAAIAHITGIPERTIRACLTNLRDTGWLSWYRGNRQKANDYQFDILNLAPMKAKKRRMEGERRQAKRERKTGIPDRQPTAARATIERPLTGSPLPLATGSPPPPNTLSEHPYKRASK